MQTSTAEDSASASSPARRHRSNMMADEHSPFLTGNNGFSELFSIGLRDPSGHLLTSASMYLSVDISFRALDKPSVASHEPFRWVESSMLKRVCLSQVQMSGETSVLRMPANLPVLSAQDDQMQPFGFAQCKCSCLTCQYFACSEARIALLRIFSQNQRLDV
jgi:hypothetical protein